MGATPSSQEPPPSTISPLTSPQHSRNAGGYGISTDGQEGGEHSSSSSDVKVGTGKKVQHVKLIIPDGADEDEVDPIPSDDERGITAQKRASYERKLSKQMSFRRKKPENRPSFSRTHSSFLNFGPGEQPVEPYAALAPLVTGSAIHGASRPKPHLKSVPAFAPYRRTARHRSFYLWWLNQFRHWWKSSRLLVRLAGLWVYTQVPEIWAQIATVKIWKNKGPKRATKLMKRLGQGGYMRPFLKTVKPFTRTLRIVVAVWRWIEAAKCRRGEVGVEEAMAFIGNRCSRFIARDVVDYSSRYIIFPFLAELIDLKIIHKKHWDPSVVIVVLGVIRSIAPYAASFQGSRFGRVVTRATFSAAGDRWQPTMRINDMNMRSVDCCEGDEVSSNADLVKLAKKVATALGRDAQAKPCDILGPHRANAHLEDHGFEQVGCGSGGYAVYSYEMGPISVLLHVTPYGPSIYDELPRYIVLEREESQDLRGEWSDFISEYLFVGPRALEGYCYKGAFFSPWQWAELKERYDSELMAYDNACKAICRKKLPETMRTAGPPTDLQGLKDFLDLGRPRKQRRKNKKRRAQTGRIIDTLARNIHSKMHQRCAIDPVTGKHLGGEHCVAPAGVILYFEGLDCAGKSSTGGLVQQALEESGYAVEMRQYNRPPTEEQKKRPWMDRFERPNIAPSSSPSQDDPITNEIDRGEEVEECAGISEHQHSCMIWDRGPAGDFVYGTLAKADNDTRHNRYNEFMDFDEQCRRDNILFCKLFFVTTRDAVARVLGKRLAHKKICRDLHAWLDATAAAQSGNLDEVSREGLDEIDLHIDPTDFVAFNAYHENLDKFATFVRNTDTRTYSDWDNPWLVVSTGKRHPARIQLLKRFQTMVDRFTFSTEAVGEVMSDLMDFFAIQPVQAQTGSSPYTGTMVEQDLRGGKDLETLKRGLRKETLYGIIILTLLVYFYINRTYDFDVNG